MICQKCGGRLIGIIYPNGYEELECEKCGCGIQDARMNEVYNEKYANRPY